MRIYSLIGRVEEWLDEIFSWLGKRYKNRFLHQKWLNLVFLCRRGWIVISSL